MHYSMQRKGLWLASLTGRLTVLALLSTIMLAGLYLMGNYQHFLETTLMKLLLATRISSLVWAAASIFYMLSLLLSLPYVKRFSLLRLCASLISAGAGLMLYAGTAFLLSWVV